MDRIEIDLKHCYGIKSLKQTFDFSTGKSESTLCPQRGNEIVIGRHIPGCCGREGI